MKRSSKRRSRGSPFPIPVIAVRGSSNLKDVVMKPLYYAGIASKT